jgi:hypothetical protein
MLSTPTHLAQTVPLPVARVPYMRSRSPAAPLLQPQQHSWATVNLDIKRSDIKIYIIIFINLIII